MNNNYQINIISLLNTYLANIVVLRNKIYNFHFNIIGNSFLVVHNKTREYYQYINELYDNVGERIKMLDGYPIMDFTEIVGLSSIKDVISKNYDMDDVYESLVTDFTILLSLTDQISNYTTNVNDLFTSDMMSKVTMFLENELWQIKSIYK